MSATRPNVDSAPKPKPGRRVHTTGAGFASQYFFCPYLGFAPCYRVPKLCRLGFALASCIAHENDIATENSENLKCRRHSHCCTIRSLHVVLLLRARLSRPDVGATSDNPSVVHITCNLSDSRMLGGFQRGRPSHGLRQVDSDACSLDIAPVLSKSSCSRVRRAN